MANSNDKKLVSVGKNPFSVELDDNLNINFSPEQKELIKKIKIVHGKCPKKNNDFEDTYREAMILLEIKATPLWYEGVANQLVDIFEYCEEDFFNAFDIPNVSTNPQKNQDFERDKIRLLDLKEDIQGIKHKRRESISKIFRGEFYTKFGIDIEVTDQNYVQIFKIFEDELISLFKKYKIKS